MTAKSGLQLDRVVLLGRTFEEYRRYFQLEPDTLRGKSVLDVAGGVSSFCAEGNDLGIHVRSVDPVYALSPEEIARRTGPDLDKVIAGVGGLPTYRWTFYRDPEHVREFRQRASARFIADFAQNPGRYIRGALPRIPVESQRFDLTLVSYFLFAYEEHFSYEFHRDSILELMRVTRGEARIYPTVTFEAERSSYFHRIQSDPSCLHLAFEHVETDFEFLLNSNYFLRITHRAADAG